MSASRTLSLLSLPNELLLHILTPFPTQSLLALAPVCQRLHALIYRLILQRLRAAANPPDHTLLLECYHPSAKLTEPALYCTYLRTPGLPADASAGTAPRDSRPPQLRHLRALYSTFAPQRRAPSPPAAPARHPAGEVSGTRTHAAAAARAAQGERVAHVVSLEGHELFAQLCAAANLVRPGPRPGLFGSVQRVEEGVVRVWRQWLGRAAARGAPGGGAGARAEDWEGDESVLWVDLRRHVGLRVSVRSREWKRNMPVLWSASDDDVAVSYEIELQGTSASASHGSVLRKLTRSRTHCTNITSTNDLGAVAKAGGQHVWQGNRFRSVYMSSATLFSPFKKCATTGLE